LGASLAGWLPLGFRYLGVSGNTESGIPLTIKYAFQLGAVAFLLAVLYTVFTTKEYPPENMEEFLEKKKASGGFFGIVGEVVTEISEALRALPKTMLQLAPVQMFTWLGLFCMWLFYVPAVARHVFGAVDAQSEAYTRGQEFGGSTFAYMNIICFAIAFAIPVIARKIGKKATHAICLTCGAIGLLSVYFISNPNFLIGSMCLIGVAWASILSMPYAILSGALPAARMGVYMGVFNFFIVIPEIVQALTFGPIIRGLFGADNPNSSIYMVLAGGCFMLLAAILTLFLVKDVSGNVPERDVIRGDEKEPLTVQQSAQPVPSSGMNE
jgi:maltose/moltooligosaccharide transporter